ncbi:MAG: hypothetical protein NZZ41_04190 [Candidatus Dojkabacteria bacterium]|nr:hypothetical protein [Candidatus Dojkabacteria bacterium]
MTTPFMVKAAGNNFSTTLTANITSTTLSIPLSSVSGLNPDGGYLIIDKDNSAREIIYYTSISGSSVNVAVDGRGRCGTVAVAHTTGAVVTDVIVDEHINRPSSAFLSEHLDNGTHRMNLNFWERFKYEALINGRIEATTASNNLTIALKTYDGTDATTTNPIMCYFLNENIRRITSALSLTINGSNTVFGFNTYRILPSTGTTTVDLFVHLILDGTNVRLGVSRINYASITIGEAYTNTTTSARYLALSGTGWNSNALIQTIGRVSVTVDNNGNFSGTPTIVQGNIGHTLRRQFFPIVQGTGSMTASAILNGAFYFFNYNLVYIQFNFSSLSISGTFGSQIRVSLPIPVNQGSGLGQTTTINCGGLGSYTNNILLGIAGNTDTDTLALLRIDGSNYAATTNGWLLGSIIYMAQQ